MRNFILFSIVLNVALAAAVGYQVWRNPAIFATTSANGTTATNEESALQFLKRKKVQQTVVVTNEAGAFTWANVESPDYKAYIANLRLIGCPEETIRDIILADVEKHFRGKLAPLRKPRETRFWKSDRYYGQGSEFNEAVRQFEKEKRTLLKELLGSDALEQLKNQSSWDDGKDPFASLSEDKRDQMEEIAIKFQDLERTVYRRAQGQMLDEDNKELERLRKQRRDEIAKVLTPEELFEWEVRNSPIADSLKWNEMVAFDATEEEFRAIFKTKQAQQDALGDDSGDEKADRERRRLSEKQANEQLNQVLGDERFKEYELSQNWDYREITELTDGLDLSRNVAKQVYGMKDEVEKAMQQVQKDETLTEEQRNARLQEIKTATEQEIIQKLGEAGYKTIKRNVWWVQEMVPAKPKS